LARALALGVLRTAQEVAAPARPQLHRPAAVGARLADRHLRHLLLRRRRRQLVLELLAHLLRELLGAAALREGAAPQERPAEALADHHRRAALVTLDAQVHRLDRLARRVDVLGVLALGVAGAGQERAVLALPQHHRLAAL